jgi:hypothetical protein
MDSDLNRFRKQEKVATGITSPRRGLEMRTFNDELAASKQPLICKEASP